MSESSALLHNMSTPPKTVLKYSGLPNPARTFGRGDSGVVGISYRSAGVFGIPIHFVLAPCFAQKTPAQILELLGADSETDPARQLVALINRRAEELPLPDGCAAIYGFKDAIRIWEDPLTALAIMSKCSESVWLRAKTPAIHAALAQRAVTLLVPPKFAARIPELQQHGVRAAAAQVAIPDDTVSAGQAIEPAEAEVSPAPKSHFMRRGGTGLNRR